MVRYVKVTLPAENYGEFCSLLSLWSLKLACWYCVGTAVCPTVSHKKVLQVGSLESIRGLPHPVWALGAWTSYRLGMSLGIVSWVQRVAGKPR